MDSKCLNFLQLNTDFSKASTLLLEKYMHEYDTDVALIQDIYCEKFGLDQKYKPPDFVGYNLLYYKDEAMPKVAIYIRRNINTTILPQASNSHCITCVVHLENAQNIVLSSGYCPPPDISSLLRTDSLFSNLSTLQIQNLLLCGDFNSHSSLWSNKSKNDKKGDELEILFYQNDLTVLNDVESPPTFENTRGGVSWIDLTVAGSKITDRVANWKVHDVESLSFHKIINFSLNISPITSNVVRYNFEKTNWNEFNTILETNFTNNNISVEKPTVAALTDIDDLARRISISIKETIMSHVPSYVNYKNRRLVSWWNNEIAILRKSVNKARREKHNNPSQIS